MILDLFLESYWDHDAVGPAIWTDAAGDDYMSRNMQTDDVDDVSGVVIANIFAFIIAFGIACALSIICQREAANHEESEQARQRRLESPPTRRERETRRELEALEGGETSAFDAQSATAPQSVTAPPSQYDEKSTVEYMAFYSDAFENNNQQQTLLSSQLFEGDPTKAQGGEMNKKGQNHETINSALSSARSYRRSSNRNLHRDDTGDNGDDDDSVIVKNQTSSTRQNKSMCLFHPRGHGFNGKTRRIIGVHCAICLDDIQAKETIVWSETESCPHIFHKKCLIPFLAFNKEAQLKLPPHRRHEVQNPCPTCRQSFITLDLAWA